MTQAARNIIQDELDIHSTAAVQKVFSTVCVDMEESSGTVCSGGCLCAGYFRVLRIVVKWTNFKATKKNRKHASRSSMFGGGVA